MDKEKVSARLKQLQEERETLNKQIQQGLSTMNAYDGAIQDCQHWLTQFEEEVNVENKSD